MTHPGKFVRELSFINIVHLVIVSTLRSFLKACEKIPYKLYKIPQKCNIMNRLKEFWRILIEGELKIKCNCGVIEINSTIELLPFW